MSKINTNNNTKPTKTFSKKSQVAIICGELANTYYNTNSAFADMPIILVDTQSLDLPKVPKNNYTKIELGDSGTGANPQVGRELAKNQAQEIMELVKEYDVVNIFFGVGGGTSGSALEIADMLKDSKLVLVHPMSLISIDSSTGNRTSNLNHAIESLASHNHCWIRPGEIESIKELGILLKNRVDDLLAVTSFKNLDNNDFYNLFSDSEFAIHKGNDPISAKTQLQRFLGNTISSFFVGQSSEDGSLVGAKMLQLLLKNHLKENGKSKVAPRFGSSELLAVLCR
jgi:Tubulin/FtsZ family, GTPase domain